jgi:predicted hydrocarbon binding protein/predicted amino acid-binding ACT domain protein
MSKECEKDEPYLKNPTIMTFFEKREGSKYFEVFIGVDNVPGMIAKVSSVIASFNVNIMSGFHSAIPDYGGAWAIFLEVPQEVAQEELLAKLRLIGGVKEVRVKCLEHIDFFDEFFFPLMMGRERILMVAQGAFMNLKGQLIDFLGTGGEFILFNEGKGIGESFIAGAPPILKTYLEKLEYIKDLFRASGWGLLEFQGIEIEKKSGTIILKDNFEASSKYAGHCHLTRGSLTTIVRRVFNKPDIELVEIACKGLGDPACIFKLS